jgi:hypothetical protein
LTNKEDISGVQTQKPMPKPSSEIDMQAITTFPHISSDYMSDRIRNKFRKFSYSTNSDGDLLVDENGNPKIQIDRDFWANMEIFTQDFRLGNLNKEEAHYVRYHIDLCSDILTTMPESFHKPALISLQRAIAVTETSQSKGGFLRRMFNTFFSHSSNKEDTPTKRSFFGLGKKR